MGLGLGLAALVVGTGLWWQKTDRVDVQTVGLDEWDPADFNSVEPELEGPYPRREVMETTESTPDDELDLMKGESGRSLPGPALFTTENGSEQIARLPEGIDGHGASPIDHTGRQHGRTHEGAKLIGVIEEIPADEEDSTSKGHSGESSRTESHIDFAPPQPSSGQNQGHAISVVPGEYSR
ncbi:MAG: hypothetical protein ACKVT0_04725 [Planctomycetaceae bacterium]